MHVSATSPLAVAKLVWRPRPDAFVMTVVAKATYALRNGPCELLGMPDAPQTTDVYWPDGSPRSVRLPTDLAPFKRLVDVMVVGHAWAPQGQAVSSFVPRLAVGPVNKPIVVYGDRVWMSDGRLSEPTPFTRMPLRWMRAAGGPRSWNPVGIAPSVDPKAPGPPPNFEPLGFLLRSPMQEVPPVGFGPIAARWPTRVEHLRAHRNTWSHEAWHEQPLPVDVDASYFNAAPKDQQIQELPVQAQILLEHLHPELPRMIAVVEDVRPQATVTRSGGHRQEVWLRADTLLIDTDRGVCSVTWRAAVPLRHPQEEGTVVVAPTRGIPAPKPEPSRRPRTLVLPADAPLKVAATLPFAPKSAPAPPPPEPRRERPAVTFEDDGETTLVGAAGKPEGSVTLPFQRSPLRQIPASSVTPAAHAIEPGDVGTTTLIAEPKAAAPAPLPFVAAHTVDPVDDAAHRTLVPVMSAPATSVLPFRPAEPAPAADEPEPETERKPQIQADVALPFGKSSPVASPLFVLSAPGPSVRAPEPAVRAPEPTVRAPEPAVRAPEPTVRAPEPAVRAPEPAVRAPEPVKRGELSIERYARIKVDLWGAGVALHEVLARYGIDEVAWRVHERQQAEALAGEAREGRCDLALALCAAFEAAKAPGVAPPPLGGIA